MDLRAYQIASLWAVSWAKERLVSIYMNKMLEIDTICILFI